MALPSDFSDAQEVERLTHLHVENLGADAPASQSAAHGIFSHHGNTPHGIRLAGEHAMRDDLVRFVVCTSTLAQGVNLPIRRQQLEITRALEMAGAATRIQEIVGANQHWQDLIKQATATSRIAESLSAAHQSWLDTIKPIQHDFSQLSQLQASAKLALCDTSLRLTATERLMAGIDFEAIRGRSLKPGRRLYPQISQIKNGFKKSA